MRFSNLITVLFFLSTPLYAANITLQCGENAQLNSIKTENLTVDFVTKDKEVPAPAIGSIKLKSTQFELKDLAHLTQVALGSEIDPYVLMGLSIYDKGNISVGGLPAARIMGCAIRERGDIKHFSAADMEALKAAREKLRQLNAERSRIKGGEDYEEWQALQKDVEKYQRLNDDLKAKIGKLTGDKKEEMQDQIADNKEEIKGLLKEQEDYTKSPEMKKIVSLEAQRYAVRQQIETVRVKALQNVSEEERAEVSREFECLKSDDCFALILKNEKSGVLDVSEGSSASSVVPVCMAGDVISDGAVDFSKTSGACCVQAKIPAGAKAAQEVAIAAAARGLKDTFQSCQSRPAENDCFARYLEFKGDCAHAYGTQLARMIVADLFSNTDLHRMVANEAKRSGKKVVSSFCVGQKKQTVSVTDAMFADEFKKFIKTHKSCAKIQ